MGATSCYGSNNSPSRADNVASVRRSQHERLAERIGGEEIAMQRSGGPDWGWPNRWLEFKREESYDLTVEGWYDSGSSLSLKL